MTAPTGGPTLQSPWQQSEQLLRFLFVCFVALLRLQSRGAILVPRLLGREERDSDVACGRLTLLEDHRTIHPRPQLQASDLSAARGRRRLADLRPPRPAESSPIYLTPPPPSTTSITTWQRGRIVSIHAYRQLYEAHIFLSNDQMTHQEGLRGVSGGVGVGGVACCNFPSLIPHLPKQLKRRNSNFTKLNLQQ